MTEKIAKLRQDKGFGFLKDDGGQRSSFIRAPSTAKGSPICAKVTA